MARILLLIFNPRFIPWVIGGLWVMIFGKEITKETRNTIIVIGSIGLLAHIFTRKRS